ncbi:MAG: hypothetical protein LBB94_00980, partial [Clostridiales bacterium]|nr:hypothetical protein [Clostridiales bacterium]
MLTYMIKTTEQLILMAILLGSTFAYRRYAYDDRGKKYCQFGVIVGVVSAGLMTYFKIYTSKVDTGLWNLRIYAISIAALISFIVFTILKKRTKKAGEIAAAVSMATLAAMLILYYLPPVLEIPHTVLLTEKTILTTNFLLKMSGVLFGVTLILAEGVSVYKGSAAAGKSIALAYFLAVALVNSAKYAALAFSVMLAKRIIKSNHTMFVFSKYASNYSDWFIYIALLFFLVIQIGLILKSYRANEPYNNPAEKRKITAKWRKRRKWAVITIICSVI